MAKIKRVNAILQDGLLNNASGQLAIIELVRNGVIRGLKNPIHIKRPNQYRN